MVWVDRCCLNSDSYGPSTLKIRRVDRTAALAAPGWGPQARCFASVAGQQKARTLVYAQFASSANLEPRVTFVTYLQMPT
jgi:hypothetical protein